MEYIYAALLIHKAGHKVDEATVTKVLTAAGVKVEESRVKALVAALEGVNIDEAVKKAAAAPVAAAHVEHKAEGKKEEKKPAEDEKKNEEQAAAGLSALFG